MALVIRSNEVPPKVLSALAQRRTVTGDTLMITRYEAKAGAEFEAHSHPEEQWGVLLEGECIRLQGDEEVAMKAGDFWHTPGGVAHSIRTGCAGALVLDIFSPPRQEYTRVGEGFGQHEIPK
jgi:quercetin dioxygenase-like cupin family protein